MRATIDEQRSDRSNEEIDDAVTITAPETGEAFATTSSEEFGDEQPTNSIDTATIPDEDEIEQEPGVVEAPTASTVDESMPSADVEANALDATVKTSDGSAGTPVVVRTFGARLSVRSGPGTDFQRLEYIQDGSTHQVLRISDDGAWLQIPLPSDQAGAVGWISADFAQPAKTTFEDR